MTAQLIDGKAIAANIRTNIAVTIQKMAQKGLKTPELAVVLVGEDPASSLYVKNKQIACKEVGIVSHPYSLPTTIREDELLALIDDLNHDPRIDGILVQLPLPSHIDTQQIIEALDPTKDVDGFHPYNLGRLAQKNPLLRPCTPLGIMHLLDHTQEHYKNRHAVIIGASNIVGRPMALELLMASATVTVCHRFTQDLRCFVSQADIVISAVGIPGLIQGEWIKPQATIIDVGITRLPNGHITGDIDFATAKENAAWITPVPGGVGPMTVAMLLQNTLQACQLREGVLINN